MKKNILVVSTSGFKNKEGISTLLYDYISIIVKNNSINFVIAVDGNYDERLVNTFSLLGCNIVFLPDRKKQLLKYIIELKKIILLKNIDTLYINGSSTLMSLELLLCKMNGVKRRIVHSHNTTCSHKFINKLLQPLFNHLVTSSIACGEEAGKWLFKNNDFIVVKNARKIEKYKFNEEKRMKMRSLYSIGSDNVIANVGTLSEQKNQKFLINTFYEYKKIDPSSKLFIIGFGDKKDELINQVANLGLEKDVIFTGKVDNVEDYLQMFDLMVLPSLFEGLPLVAIEWQISGLPCIISDTITSECVCTDLVSYMSLNDSYELWAKKIADMLNISNRANESNIEKIRNNGYDINESAKRLEKILVD